MCPDPFSVYLAGAVEHAPDGGLGWRARVERFLGSFPGAVCVNPAVNETKPLTEEERARFRKWRETDYPRFHGVMQKIIQWDLEQLSRCQAVICFWDDACARGAGTQGELTLAWRLGLPVYLVAGVPLGEVPSWALGCASEVFESPEALEKRLAQEWKRLTAKAGSRNIMLFHRAHRSETGVIMQKSFRGQTGWIEVICGSMFSGKSEELIRRLKRAEIARLRIQVFKPAIDNRYAEEHIVSHSELRYKADVVSTSQEIKDKLQPRTEVIGIDEAQFFDPGIVEVCNLLADMGKRVIVAGLDKDYLGRPFEPMPQLMAVAEDVTKIAAICMQCGAPAHCTQRLIESNERIVVGAAGSYEARCRRCFEPEGRA